MIHTCSKCGVCCKLFLINLSEIEYRSGTYQTMFEEFGLIDDFRLASSCGSATLKQKDDGSCIYLEGTICSIHNRRPQACKDFFCTSKLRKFRENIDQIKKAIWT
jgi:Fe-S-cluster containining protein